MLNLVGNPAKLAVRGASSISGLRTSRAELRRTLIAGLQSLFGTHILSLAQRLRRTKSGISCQPDASDRGCLPGGIQPFRKHLVIQEYQYLPEPTSPQTGGIIPPQIAKRTSVRPTDLLIGLVDTWWR